MYQTQNITKKELQQIEITNQQEVEERTKSNWDILNIWEVIKTHSSNFTVEAPKALEADALLYNLIHAETKNNDDELEKERIRIQAQARARSFAFLRVKLELELQKAA